MFSSGKWLQIQCDPIVAKRAGMSTNIPKISLDMNDSYDFSFLKLWLRIIFASSPQRQWQKVFA